jgi:hypothetical protein
VYPLDTWDDDDTPDDRDNAPDHDVKAAAYHEAGHAIACVLCGVGWTEVWVLDTGFEAGRTTYSPSTSWTPPRPTSFISWAGCWAEARYISPDEPWRVLPDVQFEGGADDMAKVAAYRADPTHAPHETDEQWARNLDSAWKHVETLARQLARQRVVKTPLHPDFEPG